MLKSGKNMSKIGKINRFLRDLAHPVVKILLCGYAENFSTDYWYHPNRIRPFRRFYRVTRIGFFRTGSCKERGAEILSFSPVRTVNYCRDEFADL